MSYTELANSLSYTKLKDQPSSNNVLLHCGRIVTALVTVTMKLVSGDEGRMKQDSVYSFIIKKTRLFTLCY